MTNYNVPGFIILGIIIVIWIYVISIFVGGCNFNNTLSNYYTSSKELHLGESVTLKEDH